MASPETTLSTRRFCYLPSEESLLATGSASPIPAEETVAGFTLLLHQESPRRIRSLAWKF